MGQSWDSSPGTRPLSPGALGRRRTHRPGSPAAVGAVLVASCAVDVGIWLRGGEAVLCLGSRDVFFRGPPGAEVGLVLKMVPRGDLEAGPRLCADALGSL